MTRKVLVKQLEQMRTEASGTDLEAIKSTLELLKDELNTLAHCRAYAARQCRESDTKEKQAWIGILKMVREAQPSNKCYWKVVYSNAGGPCQGIAWFCHKASAIGFASKQDAADEPVKYRTRTERTQYELEKYYVYDKDGE